jgi:hypothetical protein
MIMFGTAVTEGDVYLRYAEPGIRLAREPDSEVVAHRSAGSLFRNYNLLLDQARAHADLEALVLIHQDAELADSDFCDRIRDALSDAEVAIIGCAGAVGVKSIAWWDGAVTWASFSHRYEELGGGEINAQSWRRLDNRDDGHAIDSTGEVDSIDGLVMVLSPWAVRNLRFDESLGTLHGYDFDFCCQARAKGKKVVTADFRTIHHHSLDLISNPEAWKETYVRLVEKWDGQFPDADNVGADWRSRALRAEADAAAARGQAISYELRFRALEERLNPIIVPLRTLRRALRTIRRRRGG